MELNNEKKWRPGNWVTRRKKEISEKDVPNENFSMSMQYSTSGVHICFKNTLDDITHWIFPIHVLLLFHISFSGIPVCAERVSEDGQKVVEESLVNEKKG